MNKKYIIIHKNEISQAILMELNYSKDQNIAIIPSPSSDDSGYRVLSLKNNTYPNSIKDYKKMDVTEVQNSIAAIKSGNNTERFSKAYSRKSAFKDSEGKRARFKGGFKFSAPAGQQTSQDFTLTEDRLFTGANYKATSSNFGDYIEFEVVHPVYGTLDKFIETWYLSDDYVSEDAYPAKIPAGLTLRVTYNNVGAQEAKIWINLKLHKVG